ncbi:MAG: DEAD/DEAH box helicase [Rhodobacteraceae bacterium]|nr:DEAD/DEAH box helicase [Paracoccaceae bacterium]
MEFRIADTFTDSLARLTGGVKTAIKTTAFDLQLNPANSGLSFHRLDRAPDNHFRSVRAGSDLRLIVLRSNASLLLCYVDHHDKAYDWAERRKLETHPKTGAAQLVEIRETVKEIVVPAYTQKALRAELVLEPKPAPELPPLFAGRSDDELLGYGVPAEWLADVKQANEDTLLALSDHLPAAAAEALLELATGGKPRAPTPAAETVGPFDHPDAQRRFRVMSNVDELQRALELPWDKWAVFLHPEQQQWVERDHAGPARVAGSAGTGKTIVALHRAAYLARTNNDARVLLTTFSDTLASALHAKLKRLLAHKPRLAERIDVHSLEAVGLRLYTAHVGPPLMASREFIREVLNDAASAIDGHRFSVHFVLTEWEQVVDAWQLTTWDEYRDVVRLGRKSRLPEAQRAVLWSIFERLRARLHERKLITHAEPFTALAAALSAQKKVVLDFAVVDEAQDLGVAHLRFLAALGGGRPNALFLAGDLGQRIFQQPFSCKALGVDIRGRSRTLRVNYRTSHQIHSQADRLLGPTVTDVDGNSEDRSDTVSVSNGPPPIIHNHKDESEEIGAVAKWLTGCAEAGLLPHEIGVFVQSEAQLDRARAAVRESGLAFKVLDEQVETISGQVAISTTHLAKGLEFRAVVVMACDDEVIPLQERIETVGDDADLQEVYDTERHLLHVACARARDRLLMTSVEPASGFLDDMRSP